MKIFFIDDNPVRAMRFLEYRENAVVANSVDSVIEAWKVDSKWDVVCLEWYLDSSSDKHNADKIIEWLEDQEERPEIGSFIIHTLDKVMAYEGIVKLNILGYKARWIPFDKLEGMLKQGYLS